VKKYFETYGKVADVQLARREGQVNSKGHGFVWFESEHILKLVTSMKHSIGGRKVNLSFFGGIFFFKKNFSTFIRQIFFFIFKKIFFLRKKYREFD